MYPTACECKVDCESLDVESDNGGESSTLLLSYLILIAFAQRY